MSFKISVIIPTREPDVKKNLSLQRAIDSVHTQVGVYDWDICISSTGNQAEAVNECCKAAQHDLFAFLEDDDTWEGDKIVKQIDFMYESDLDFVTCSQILMKSDKSLNGLVHFPTPSGWLMRKEVWDTVGGFNEKMKLHVDTEWLLRYMKTTDQDGEKFRRGHIYPFPHLSIPGGHGEIEWVKQNAVVRQTMSCWPLVTKYWGPETLMGQIRDDESFAEESRMEMENLVKLYKQLPW